MAQVIFTVTVPGGTGGGYYIDGVQKPIVPVVTDGTFRFNQNDSTNDNHPLILSTTTNTAGIISTGVTYYLDGVSNETDYRNTTLFNAASVRYIEITVSQISDFYYLCSVHGFSMGNTVDVTEDTWGQSSWNAGNWGDQNPNINVIGSQLNITVGNEEAFTDVVTQLNSNSLTVTLSSPDVFIGVLIQPNSNLLNTSVNSIFGGELINVQVTAPGSPTTWGEYTWNEQAWGQILGLQSEIGEENTFIDVNVLLNTNLLTVTLDPNYEILIGVLEQPTGVLITSTVNSVFAGELITTNVTGVTINSTSGTLVINADANVTPNTNLLNITIGDESIAGDANLILSTNLLNIVVDNVIEAIDAVVELTTPGSPSEWGEYAWNQQGWGRIVGLEVDQGAEEVVTPSIEVDVIGVQLSTTVASVSTIADANLTLNTNLLTTSLGNEDVTPNTQVILSTNLLNITVGAASGQALVDVAVTGVSMTPSTGRLFVSGWAVINIGVTNTWTVVDIAA